MSSVMMGFVEITLVILFCAIVMYVYMLARDIMDHRANMRRREDEQHHDEQEWRP